jgi:hypothetical protein
MWIIFMRSNWVNMNPNKPCSLRITKLRSKEYYLKIRAGLFFNQLGVFFGDPAFLTFLVLDLKPVFRLLKNRYDRTFGDLSQRF